MASFQRELENRLSVVYENCKEQLAMGNVPDYPGYRARTGYLAALRDVMDIIKDIQNPQPEQRNEHEQPPAPYGSFDRS